MPKPIELGIDPRTARFGVLVLLQGDAAGPIAQHEAVAILVPRSACRAGSSLRVDSARAAQNPPSPSGVVAYSAPPANMTSASPY